MKRIGAVVVFVVVLSLLLPTSVLPADDAKVKEGMSQVERGAKETAKGVGTTVVEGAKYSGDKVKDAGQATAAPAKGAWGGVKSFFTGLFSN
jgi:hypothetical protein